MKMYKSKLSLFHAVKESLPVKRWKWFSHLQPARFSYFPSIHIFLTLIFLYLFNLLNFFAIVASSSSLNDLKSKHGLIYMIIYQGLAHEITIDIFHTVYVHSFPMKSLVSVLSHEFHILRQPQHVFWDMQMNGYTIYCQLVRNDRYSRFLG